MTRTPLFLASLTLLVGCSSNKDGPDAARPVNPETIAEAPMPAIQSDTFAAAGDLAASRGQFARAASQYEQALQVKPADAATARKLALAYVKADRLTDAIGAWKRYLTLSNGADDAYGSLGYAYELSGKPAEAEVIYKQGVAANPKGQLTHVNYGLMLVRRNDVDAAVQQLSAVLKPPEVNYNIAGVYANLGRRDLADFYYKRALECDPGFVPARQKLSMVQ
ncbi:MAG TPA: tetratricopeptide repeat protein [Tepidisphaeraceae bacterium]|jgi:Tfp pilus assembly protein PilF